MCFSCTEKDPYDNLRLDKDYSTSPVFTFSANEGEYEFIAGVGGFYMFSDYAVDDDDVYNFTSRFSKLSTCTTDCIESLFISVRDFQVAESTAAVDIFNATSQGDYDFASGAGAVSFGDVVVSYTDENGVNYRSDNLEQPVESAFTILSSEEYNINEHGDSTRILSVSFNCVLQDEVNELEINFINAKATIAVAYPN